MSRSGSARWSSRIKGLAALPVGVAVLLSLAPPIATAALVAPRSAPTAQSTAYAVIGTLATPSQGGEIAVINNDDADISDDTVFVGLASDVLAFRPGASTGAAGSSLGISSSVADLAVSDNGLYVIFGLASELSRYPASAYGVTAALATVSLPESPTTVAVGGRGTASTEDDSVYVGYYNNRTSIDGYSRDLASSASLAITLSNPQPSGITVGGGHTPSTADDTVYVVGNGLGSGTLVQFPPNMSTQADLRPGYGIGSAAVFDDSLVIGPYAREMRALRVTNWDDSVPMGANGGTIASSRLGVVGSLNIYSPFVSFVPVGSASADDTLPLTPGLSSDRDIAFAGDGVAYVTYSTTAVALIDKITAAVPASTSGAAGSTLEIALTLQSGRSMDDSTVSAVWFGSTQVPAARVTGMNAVSVVVPEESGSVPLTVEFRGGNAVDAGSFTVTPAPEPVNPPAPVPASSPISVSAEAGNASATVSWSAPESSGSYPVSHYLVTSSPGSRTCLTVAPALACDVTDLSNGTAYTFTVKALTGAGWSAASVPSNAVTPSPRSGPSIVITGSREGKRIEVRGTATGFGMGGILVPWVRLAGEADYSAGSSTILVSADGTFEWSRRSDKRAHVYVATPAGEVKSNTVVVRRR